MTVPTYVYSSGIRTVVPYYITRTTFAKQRWLNRPILDVLSEFKQLPMKQLLKDIDDGKISIIRNRGTSKSIPEVTYKGPELMETTIQNGDILCRTEHGHEDEIPIAAPMNTETNEPDITTWMMYEDEEILVIDKPNGIPVHPSPTGSFYYNSLTKIILYHLKFEVYPIHRLDKLTSGIIVFAKSNKAAGRFAKLINSKNTNKEYLAKVRGKFPSKTSCKTPITLHIPLKRQIKGPWDAHTDFELASYNATEDTSIVKCFPKTGRTHQIRIHLRDLGFPIVNDPLYGENCTSRHNGNFDELIAIAEESQKKNFSGEVCPECSRPLCKKRTADDFQLALHAWKLSYQNPSSVTKQQTVYDKFFFEAKLPDWA